MDNKKVSMDIIVFSICVISLICIFFSVAYSTIATKKTANNMNVKDAHFTVNKEELSEKGSIDLYGMWEYYDGVHLISDNADNKLKPTSLVYVPMAWNMFDKFSWGENGKASYRIVINGLPQDGNLTFYLHGIPQVFNIYIDGVLQDSTPEKNKLFVRGGTIQTGGECEIIIEVTSQWLTGLYACPWLYTNGVYENKVIFARDIWSISIGAFLIAFLFFLIFFRKIRDRPYALSFIRNILLIAVFYEMVYIELSNDIQVFSKFISLERLHILVASLSIILVYFTIDFQIKLFPDIFDKRIILGLQIPIYITMFLKLLFGAYIDMSSVISCFIAALLVYISVCTYEGILRKTPGLVFISIASVLIGITMLMVSVFSSQRFFWWTYSMLPIMFLAAILCYVNFFAIEFAIIEEAAQREHEASRQLVDAEIAYLTSQIQPHFQYNSLTTIQELCYTDPRKAAEAIGKYSSFLRKKVDFKNFSNLIPFSEELNCIDEYIYMQELRFENAISFVKDIRYDDFAVPPLSIQTLVENSIHHGLRKKVCGGKVIVRTEKIENTIHISIIDNGIGFDVSTLENASGQGIFNSRFRIETLLNGSLNIESIVGEGTKIEIIIHTEVNKK